MKKFMCHCGPGEVTRVAKYFCLPMTANMTSFMRKRNETNITAILGVNNLSDMNELRFDDLRTCSDQAYQMRQKMRFIGVCSCSV
jgi:hypothetical protein